MAREDQKYDTANIEEKYFGKTVENTQVEPTGNLEQGMADAEDISTVIESGKIAFARGTKAVYNRLSKAASGTDLFRQFTDPFYMTRKVNKDFLYSNADKLQELVTNTLTPDEVQNLLEFDDTEAREKLRNKITELTLDGLNKAKNLVTPEGSTFSPDFEDWAMDAQMKLQFKDVLGSDGPIPKFAKQLIGGGLGMALNPFGLMFYTVPASINATGVRGFMLKGGAWATIGAAEVAFIEGENQGYDNISMEDVALGAIGGFAAHGVIEGLTKGIGLGARGISNLKNLKNRKKQTTSSSTPPPTSPKGTPSTLQERAEQNTPLDSTEIAFDAHIDQTDFKYNNESFIPEAPETGYIMTTLNKEGNDLIQKPVELAKESSFSEFAAKNNITLEKDGYNYATIGDRKIENHGKPPTQEQYNEIADMYIEQIKNTHSPTEQNGMDITHRIAGAISASTENLHKQFSRSLRSAVMTNKEVYKAINKDRNFLNEVVTRTLSQDPVIIDPKYRHGQVFVDVLRETFGDIPKHFNANGIPMNNLELYQMPISISPYKMRRKVNNVRAKDNFVGSYMQILDFDRIRKHKRDLIEKEINYLKKQTPLTEKIQKEILQLEKKLENKKKPMTVKEKRAFCEAVYNDQMELMQNRSRYSRTTTPNTERKVIFYKPDQYLNALEMWGKGNQNFFSIVDDFLLSKASELAVFRILGVNPARTLSAMLKYFEPAKPDLYNSKWKQAAFEALPTNWYKVLENMHHTITSGGITNNNNNVTAELMKMLLIYPKARALVSSFVFSLTEEMFFRGFMNNKLAFDQSPIGTVLNSLNSAIRKMTPEQKVDAGMGMRDRINSGYDVFDNNIIKKGSIAIADTILLPQKKLSERNKVHAAYNFSAFMNDMLEKNNWADLKPEQKKMMKFMNINEDLFKFAKENLARTQETVMNNFGSRKIVNYNKLYSDSIRSGDRLTADKAMRMLEAQEQFIDINVPESDIVRRKLYQGKVGVASRIMNIMNELSPLLLFKNTAIQISLLSAQYHGTYKRGIIDSALNGHLHAIGQTLIKVGMMFLAGAAYHNIRQALKGRETDIEKFFDGDSGDVADKIKTFIEYLIASGGAGAIGDLGMSVFSAIVLSILKDNSTFTQELRKNHVLGESGSLLVADIEILINTMKAVKNAIQGQNPHIVRLIREMLPKNTVYDQLFILLGFRYMFDQTQIYIDGEDDTVRRFKQLNKAAAASGNALRKGNEYGSNDPAVAQAIEKLFNPSSPDQ